MQYTLHKQESTPRQHHRYPAQTRKYDQIASSIHCINKKVRLDSIIDTLHKQESTSRQHHRYAAQTRKYGQIASSIPCINKKVRLDSIIDTLHKQESTTRQHHRYAAQTRKYAQIASSIPCINKKVRLDSIIDTLHKQESTSRQHHRYAAQTRKYGQIASSIPCINKKVRLDSIIDTLHKQESTPRQHHRYPAFKHIYSLFQGEGGDPLLLVLRNALQFLDYLFKIFLPDFELRRLGLLQLQAYFLLFFLLYFELSRLGLLQLADEDCQFELLLCEPLCRIGLQGFAVAVGHEAEPDPRVRHFLFPGEHVEQQVVGDDPRLVEGSLGRGALVDADDRVLLSPFDQDGTAAVPAERGQLVPQHFAIRLHAEAVGLPEAALLGIINAAAGTAVADDADLLLHFLVAHSELEELRSFYIPFQLEQGVVVLDRVQSLGGDVLLRQPPVDHLEAVLLVVLAGHSRVEDQVAQEALALPRVQVVSHRQHEVARQQEACTDQQLLPVPRVDDSHAAVGEASRRGRGHYLEIGVSEVDLILVAFLHFIVISTINLINTLAACLRYNSSNNHIICPCFQKEHAFLKKQQQRSYLSLKQTFSQHLLQ